MWYDKNDHSQAVITATKNIASAHGSLIEKPLPKTAVVLYMSGLEYLLDHCSSRLLAKRFPRFLNACPIYLLSKQQEICLLDGGRGAPQAADTLETLHAYGIDHVITAGMIGAFSDQLQVGDLLLPPYAFCEEGTSHHYVAEPEVAYPDPILHQLATGYLADCQVKPIVSTDAVYRQTYYQEQKWAQKGAVGVDMETSCLFHVGKYLGMHVVSLLCVSDLHQWRENRASWQWKMTPEMRKKILFEATELAFMIANQAAHDRR